MSATRAMVYPGIVMPTNHRICPRLQPSTYDLREGRSHFAHCRIRDDRGAYSHSTGLRECVLICSEKPKMPVIFILLMLDHFPDAILREFLAGVLLPICHDHEDDQARSGRSCSFIFVQLASGTTWGSNEVSSSLRQIKEPKRLSITTQFFADAQNYDTKS